MTVVPYYWKQDFENITGLKHNEEIHDAEPIEMIKKLLDLNLNVMVIKTGINMTVIYISSGRFNQH
jgi:hypothetical protein